MTKRVEHIAHKVLGDNAGNHDGAGTYHGISAPLRGSAGAG